MRYGDILVDLATVVSASRSVASKHLELRAGQLDRYSKTSSLVRSLREQRVRPQQPQHPEPQSAVHPDAPGPQDPPARRDAPEVKPPGVDPSSLWRDSAPKLSEQHSKYQDLARGSRAPETNSKPLDSEPSAASPTQAANTASSPNGSGAQEEVPDGININIFHTTRGSQMIDNHTHQLEKKRPVAPPPAPSWFKDFGHDKIKASPEVSQRTTAPTAAKVPKEDVSVPSSSPAAQPEPKVDAAPTQPGSTKAEQEHTEEVKEILTKAGQAAATTTTAEPTPATPQSEPISKQYVLRESKVPATRLSRLWNYGGLAAGMLGGAISEGFSRTMGGGSEGSMLLSPANMERLVSKLSRMRGAALKLGQMLSFQDSKMLPAPIQEVLQRVQDRADYMPAWQRDRVLAASLGAEWRDLFAEFDEKPIAAASIGQVHRAVLRSSGEQVAVKIQFPGVADSINSDLDNISVLLLATKMLPKGLYLNKTIDNARLELGWECDYEREAACGQRYRELLAGEQDVFVVPRVYPEASGRHVLTMEFMRGVGVTRVASFTQEQRDWIGTQILRLCLREITEFRFMQTDPNWTNFLYNAETNKLELLDFGASREFPEEFVALYVNLLAAAARSDRAAVKDLSEKLGYLTGHESRIMLDAHIASVLTLAEPFLGTAPEVYDFQDQTITERVKALIPVMIRERLAPPPEETYSLHRKLSGAFLLCARLGSKVRCRDLFEQALQKTALEVKR